MDDNKDFENFYSSKLQPKMERLKKEQGGNDKWGYIGITSFIIGVAGSGGTTFPNTYTSGRIRAVMVDASDASGNTVFVAGVDGGLWKCTNFITGTAPNWTVVNDFFNNLAIAWIAQDPTSPDVMYFCTGEPTANVDAVLGSGLWKSTDHGATWNFLSSTSTFTQTFRIVIDNNHNVYLARRGVGIYRSSDGGASWTNITPSDFSLRSCTDIEYSSTGILHASFGYNTSANVGTNYRYTSRPDTITSLGLGWNKPVSGLPDTVGFNRIELATKGDTIYAAPTNNANNVISTYRSMDGGATWVKNNTTAYTTGVSNTQGWYNITLEINPLSAGQFLTGGLDEYLSTDSGKTVTKITNWVSTPPYVHADHHLTKWMMVAGESRIIIASDGGIFLSRDGGATFADRNQNLSIKQFYSVAIHPTTTNYFIAGAQDNGVHQFTKPGLSSSVEIIGGDGAFTAIDQDQPQFQFGAYVYNQYRRSTDGGNTWSQANFSNSAGQFINPWDYDNNNNILYGAYTSNNILRWPNPATSGSANLISTSSIGGIASTFKVSPYTANVLYVGGASGSLLKITNANATPTVTSIKDGSMPAANVSCINTGTNDQNLIMCFSNYGITNIWVSINGGTSWTGIDGNLPDMPVRWVMFYPGNNTKAIIATEAGVWETTNINGASTVWTADPTFPTVRTDMLKFRVSDGTVAAATHGRGLWTSTISIPTTTWTGATSNDWAVAGNWTNGVPNAGTNAIIPTVSPNPFPVINAVQQVLNLTINSSDTVTINSNDSLQIAGLFVNNGTIIGSGITTLLSGGLGPVTGTGTISNFTLTSGASIASGSSQSITGVLNVAGSLATNGGITLKSSAINTASIGPITNGIISGNVTVERFLSSASNRAYRLLAPSLTTSTSIHANWQEGATSNTNNPNPGYGTHITGTTTDQTNGFDATTSGQGSLFTYTNSPAAWVTAANTNVATLNGKTGYLLYIRGDRSIDLTSTSSPLPSTNTTLRATGTVLQGTQTYPGLASNDFSLVTNPYPSAINWSSIYTNNSASFNNYYTYWDPNIGSRGGYVTVTNTGVNNMGGVATVNIQSGQAFFVNSTTTSPTLTIQETDKSATNNIDVFRTATAATQSFNVSLYYNDPEHGRRIADGVTALYDNNYNASVDGNDAIEINNWDENIAIAREGNHLSIEERPTITSADTLPLFMNNMKQQGYELKFNPVGFPSNTVAFLVDNYTGKRTNLSVSAKTVVPFTITSDSASSATNRFAVMFNPGLALPVTLTSVKAYQKYQGVQVEWTTQQEINLDHYEVERSQDALKFIQIGTVMAVGNSNAVLNYSLFDPAPFNGINFYQIKSVDKLGQSTYSVIVKVNINNNYVNTISVYPNPINTNTITLQLNNLQKGNYVVKLTNKLGQQILSKVIDHPGGSATETIDLPKIFAAGIYQLSVTGGNIKITQQVIKN